MTRSDQHATNTTEPLEIPSIGHSIAGRPRARHLGAAHLGAAHLGGRREPQDQRTPRSLLERLFHVTSLVVITSVALIALSAISPTGAFAAVVASPVAPPGATGLQDLLNWTLYGGAIACAGTAMYGFAKMGISHTQQSYQGANHGKSVAILGLLGALGLGLTPTIVNGLTQIH